MYIQIDENITLMLSIIDNEETKGCAAQGSPQSNSNSKSSISMQLVNNRANIESIFV